MSDLPKRLSIPVPEDAQTLLSSLLLYRLEDGSIGSEALAYNGSGNDLQDMAASVLALRHLADILEGRIEMELFL